MPPLLRQASTVAIRVCLMALILIPELVSLVNVLTTLAISNSVWDGTLDLHPHPRRGGSLSSSALTCRLTVCSCTYVPSCLLNFPTIVLADLPFLLGICGSIFQSAAACKNAWYYIFLFLIFSAAAYWAFNTKWSFFITLAGFCFASSTVVVEVVVVLDNAIDSRNFLVGDCELLARGEIIDDDVPIAT